MQFNSYYGCGWCFHSGEAVDGVVKYTTTADPADDRTAADMIADMTEAASQGTPVRGVKGPSPVLNLPGFDIVWSFTPDYMHCVLLGVARQMTELWLTSTGTNYYIGSPCDLTTVDDRLCSIKPPLLFSRLPRSLKARKHWKAAEWEHWLLCYSLPCLRGVLSNEHFKHFGLLVHGVHLLLKKEVSKTDIDESTEKLTEFVLHTEVLYGKGQMSSNVHTLLHLPKAAVLLGPLWTHSCFVFENNMGKLLKHVKSYKGVPLQILSRVLLQSNLQVLQGRAAPDAGGVFRQERANVSNAPVALGTGHPPSDAVRSLVQRLLPHCEDVVEYVRVFIGKVTLHSTKYTVPTKTDSTVFEQDGVYARIENVISVTASEGGSKVYVIMEEYAVDRFPCVTHIKYCRRLPERKLLELTSRAKPCMYMSTNQGSLIVDLCVR
ncbi:uncharacterized protein LOC135387663 [Ornithodoros turicata]|uniref:uncharacterized protein LOC135387663 n=1 Tax=Ornithodoros turicata TaxID=34597 RepID=UPI0031392585